MASRTGAGVLAIMLSLTPAMARAREWPSAGGWDVIEVDDGCGVHLTYEGAGETELSVLLLITGGTVVFVANSDWSIKTDQEYDLSFHLDGVAYSGGKSMGTTISAKPAIMAPMSSGFLEHFAAGKSLHIYRGKTLVDQLSLTGTGAAVAMLRRCVQSVKVRADAAAREKARWAHIPKDPFADAPPPSAHAEASPPKPYADLAALITSDDYPPSALREGLAGTVKVRLKVSSSGRVQQCDVLSSSGHDVLDSTTCRLLTSRARFTPARDKNGNPVDGEFVTSERWSVH